MESSNYRELRVEERKLKSMDKRNHLLGWVIIFLLTSILLLSTSCNQQRANRHNRIAKKHLSKAESILPGVTSDTIKKIILTTVPFKLKGTTAFGEAKGKVYEDITFTTNHKGGEVITAIAYPEYAKYFLDAIEAVPEHFRDPLKKAFKKQMEGEVLYSSTTVNYDKDIEVEVPVEQTEITRTAVITVKEKVESTWGKTSKWLMAGGGILALILGILYFWKKKKG